MSTKEEAGRRWCARGLMGALLSALAACGGGGDQVGVAPAPTSGREMPAFYNPPPLPPVSTSGPVYYVADCDTGAEAGCVPGDNANAGTSPSAPKRTVDSNFVNSLPAGAQIRFARGGAWGNFSLLIVNPNATASQPIVFDSYTPSWGGLVPPLLRAPGVFAFRFGWMSDTLDDGGYVVRNLKLDGAGTGTRAFMVHNDVHDLTIDNLEMSGFTIAIESMSSSTGVVGVNRFTVRGSYIHDNSSMGFLGDGKDLVIENNLFIANNFSGSAFEHAIYLSGKGERGIVRYNNFINNSVVNGACTGGNFTVHGQWNGLLVEGNTVRQDASGGGCYGIAVNPSYDTPEWFRDLVIRGNTIVNLGNVAIGVASAPGALIENNLIVNTQAQSQTGILIPERAPGAGDDADTGATVRNNTIYFSQPNGGTGISLRDHWQYNAPVNPNATAGTNLTVVSNLIFFGPSTGGYNYCYELSPLTSYAALDHNLCRQSSTTNAFYSWGRAAGTGFTTLAQAQAAGLDVHGLDSDPLFVALPTASSYWTDELQVTSPAVDAGHPTLSSPRDRANVARSTPNIGARE